MHDAPRPYHIYGLADRVGDHNEIVDVFYIGMTNDPKGRYLQHLSGDENTAKTNKIRMLQELNLPIHMIILDTTLDPEKARKLEAYWILYHTLSGSYLTNTQAGACFSLLDLDREHFEQLSKMLHDGYGCCKYNGCGYGMNPERMGEEVAMRKR